MPEPFAPADPDRFQAALQRFDAANAEDPNLEKLGDDLVPRELIYARWLTDWVLNLWPDAPEELRLAARCQHLCRWMLPRDTYPMTRAGYLKWREELKKFHAEKAGAILRDLGYAEDTITRVQALNRKKNFPDDPASRVLEDALCLVFLEHQFADLASKTDAEKMIGVLQKSWSKMTPQGRALALGLSYTQEQGCLLQRALAPSQT